MARGKVIIDHARFLLSCRCGETKTWFRDGGEGPGPCRCGKKIWTVRRPYPWEQ